MRLAGCLIVGVMVLMTASRARAQNGTRRGEAFGPGEQSTYNVVYLGLSAGTAQVTVGTEMKQWGKEVWPIVATVKSESLVDFYPIRDRFVTYWDDRQQRTLGSDLFADENHKKRRQRIRLDGPEAQVTRQKEGAEAQETSHEVPQQTMDMAAVAFALRNKPLKVGDEYALPVFTGVKLFDLEAKVEGVEKLQTVLGSREVVRVRVTTQFSGKLAAKRDMIAYFTNDSRHVPVKIEADFLLGTVVGELTRYEPGRDKGAS
ncbi:MAG: DUF3108 domain-containing protein [Myxococcaceae bacterium]